MLLIFRIRLRDPQFIALSDISRDIGQVTFASMVVSPFLAGIDKINWLVILSGLMAALVFWFTSVFIIKRVK